MTRKRSATTSIAALCVLAWTATISAHEIGTSRVSVAIGESNRYQIEIVTDAASLMEKLEASASQSASPIADMPPARVEARLAELEGTFRRRMTLAFDGTSSQPSLHFSVATPRDATSAPVATIALTGEVPAGARQLTWSYGWTVASYAFSMRRAGQQEAQTELLEGGQSSRPIAMVDAAPTRIATRVETFARYVALGFADILPKGVDHVLFVLGLFLLTRKARPLMTLIGAFTVAHSITLALSLYHIVRLPPSIVEPLVALSIAYVAVENLIAADLTRWRVMLVFAFGLLHGLGLAGALGELSLPRSEFATALIGFNAGVEAGQLSVIVLAFAIFSYWQSDARRYQRYIVQPASVGIAAAGLWWCVQRALS